MLIVDRILGSRVDPEYSGRLHHMEHHGRVDYLTLPATELARRRFRSTTAQGTEIAIALPREQALFDGAVLLCADDKAIVVRVDAQRWLHLTPRDMATALELGYHVGNLHWRVRFEPSALMVALEGPVESYLERLTAIGLTDRIVATIQEAAPSAC